MMGSERYAIVEEMTHKAIKAVNPERAIHQRIRRVNNMIIFDNSTIVDLTDYDRIFIIGAGKATAPMARAMEEVLDDRLTAGWIVVKYDHGLPLKKTIIFEAGHPIPDESGRRATEEILTSLGMLKERDLVICLLSGGGSALFVSPINPITITDKQHTTDILLKVGAPIESLNSVRKHISRVKGGRLAERLMPARVITLVISDVVGDKLDVIASGPTFPDPSTYEEAVRILKYYEVWHRIPETVRFVLEKGLKGEMPETPKPEHPAFEKVTHQIVGNNHTALNSAAEVAKRYGYEPCILTSRLQGEAREVAKAIGSIVEEIIQGTGFVSPPVCLLLGGETTVRVTGSGKGGRNQELALALAIHLRDTPRWFAFSLGTDGTDGPTDAAGATVDDNTYKSALNNKLDPEIYLSNNDAYNFFDTLGHLIKTGPTGTNVMDIIGILIDGV